MRNRLLAAFLSIAFAILVIQDQPLASYLQTVERDSVTLSLQRDAWTLASAAEPKLVQGDLRALSRIVHGYAQTNASGVDIVDASGTLLASTRTSELGYDYSNRVEIESALQGVAVTGERDSTSLGGRMLVVSVPIRTETKMAGALRLTYPIASVDAIVGKRIRSIYLAGLVTLLVAITAAFLMAGAYTRRLRNIHSATEQLASGDLTARVATSDRGASEMRGLEAAFNLMAARLQTLVESQRSFASDASHQLRTPLTALRLRLENAAESVRDTTATEQSLEQAIIEVQRLQVLIDGLLALARLEGQALHVDTVAADPVIAERLDMWSPLAEERGLDLHSSVPSGLKVFAASGALAQVLDSYLDNALEFAPSGSRIEITAVAHEHSVDFHVIDAGPGMDADARAHAFNRFWRGRADGSGTGLGLAIASRLAEVSGGTVRLDSVKPNGVDAVLTLQRA